MSSHRVLFLQSARSHEISCPFWFLTCLIIFGGFEDLYGIPFGVTSLLLTCFWKIKILCWVVDILVKYLSLGVKQRINIFYGIWVDHYVQIWVTFWSFVGWFLLDLDRRYVNSLALMNLSFGHRGSTTLPRGEHRPCRLASIFFPLLLCLGGLWMLHVVCTWLLTFGCSAWASIYRFSFTNWLSPDILRRLIAWILLNTLGATFGGCLCNMSAGKGALLVGDRLLLTTWRHQISLTFMLTNGTHHPYMKFIFALGFCKFRLRVFAV